MNRRLTQFAYGANTYDDCPCPATAAGFNPDKHKVTEMAEQYDNQLQRSPSDSGTVDAETAKEAWLEAIDYWQRTRQQVTSDHGRKRAKHAVDIGEQIAEELDWM